MMSVLLVAPKFAVRGCSNVMLSLYRDKAHACLRACSSLASRAAATESLLQKQKPQMDYTNLERLHEKDMPSTEMENPYTKEAVKCLLCKHGITLDYKNVQLLSQFVSPHTGRVYSKHITGLCSQQQKLLENEVKKARMSGLMPYVYKDLKFVKDPQVFDPYRPVKPHPY